MGLLQKLATSKVSRRLALPLATFVTLSTGLSCSKKPTGPPPPPEEGIVYQDNAVILDDNSSQAISSANSNTITFSEPSIIKKGDVVSFPPSNYFESGQIFNVNSVSLSRDTIQVSKATLDELVKEGTLEYSKKWGSDEITIEPSEKIMGGKISAMKSNNPNYNLMFNFEKVLYDRDGNPNTHGDRIILDGNLYANVTTSGEIKFGLFGLKKASFDTNLDEQANINLTFEDRVFDLDKEIKLFHFKSAPIVIATGVYGSLHGDIYSGIKGDRPFIQCGNSSELEYRIRS